MMKEQASCATSKEEKPEASAHKGGWIGESCWGAESLSFAAAQIAEKCKRS